MKNGEQKLRKESKILLMNKRGKNLERIVEKRPQ